jgi:glycosyltransferase involved in cell wall biosynthesis/SAM-dependent methyltransferase
MTHPTADAANTGPHVAPGEPLVSVIVPFWNASAFLEEAIASVIAQTFLSWELLLVDDGSSDGSTEIAKRYAASSPGRIRYLEHDHHANRGVAASRNAGASQATGPYLAFLDADDVWLPNKLARQTAILDSEPEAAMVCGPSLFWYGWTGRPEDAARDYVKDLRIAPAGLVRPPTLLISSLTRGTFVANPSTIVIRREALERTGGFEESFIGAVQTFEDDAFLAKVQLRESVFVGTECLSKYRRHENSLLSIMTNTGKTPAGRLFYLTWLEKYLTAEAVENDEIWKALRRAFWPYRHPGLAAVRDALRLLSIRNVKGLLKRTARRTMPSAVYRWLAARWQRHLAGASPEPVSFDSPRRVTPVTRLLGGDGGLPIDCYYIARFLAANAGRIRGHALEIDDDRYTREFGGDRVTRSDVLHVHPTNSRATIVADLTSAENDIPSDWFDAIILTQTLPLTSDVHAVVKTLHRILRPGGAVLATIGGITPIGRRNMERSDHFKSFTTLSARRLFEEAFPATNVQVDAFGNVLAATAFLHGLAAEELRPSELDYHDPDYEFVITIVAVKAEPGRQGAPA